MHTIWSIPELVLEILERLDRHDQVGMARVCRSFWESAIPLIWESLPKNYAGEFIRELLGNGSEALQEDVSELEDSAKAKVSGASCKP